MTAVSVADAEAREVPSGPIWIVRDIWTEAMRHLRVIPRNPELIVFTAIQPIMFVLLFVYVFGGSISVPGFDSYRQFLLPGIMAQTVTFGSQGTSIGLADDMKKGLVDRLRSLPMAQSAVIAGRTVADFVRNFFTFVVMLGVAFAVGFRFRGSLAEAALGVFVLLLFGYALAWFNAWLGVTVKSVEAVSSAGFIFIFPMTFVSSAFVDPSNMPSWLQPVADNNPFTKVTNAARALFNGQPVGTLVWEAVAWSIGLAVFFGVLSIRRFKSISKR